MEYGSGYEFAHWIENRRGTALIVKLERRNGTSVRFEIFWCFTANSRLYKPVLLPLDYFLLDLFEFFV